MVTDVGRIQSAILLRRQRYRSHLPPPQKDGGFLVAYFPGPHVCAMSDGQESSQVPSHLATFDRLNSPIIAIGHGACELC